MQGSHQDGFPKFPGHESAQGFKPAPQMGMPTPGQGPGFSSMRPPLGSGFEGMRPQGSNFSAMRPQGPGNNISHGPPPSRPPFMPGQAGGPPGWQSSHGPPPLRPPPPPPSQHLQPHRQPGQWPPDQKPMISVAQNQMGTQQIPPGMAPSGQNQGTSSMANPPGFPPGHPGNPIYSGSAPVSQIGPRAPLSGAFPVQWESQPWLQGPPPPVAGGPVQQPSHSHSQHQQSSQPGFPNVPIQLPNMSLPPPNLPPPGYDGPASALTSLPPSLSSSQSPHVNGSSMSNKPEASQMKKSTSEEDKEWLDGWLNKKGVLRRLRTKQASHTIAIPEAKQIVREVLVTTEELERVMERLKDGMATGGSECVHDLTHAQQLKDKLHGLKSRLSDQDVFRNLVLKVKKSHAKRERLKRIRRCRYVEEREAEAKREVLHAELDRWQDMLHQEEENKLKMKEMQKAADSTLAEVRRKMNEAQRGVEVLTALRKLREVRKDAAQHRGLYTPLDADRSFESGTQSMIDALKAQLKIYEQEKCTLEVMLDAEKEETKERDDEAHRRKKHDTLEKKYNLLHNLLFGKPVRYDEEDAMYPYYQFYEAAEQSLLAFLQIRKEWDQFLVPEGTPGGTRIPAGWINPPQPASQIWASFLRDNQPPS